MNIVELGFRVTERVGRYSDRARRFFYEVLLTDLRSPCCDAGLTMASEGRCRCGGCARQFDPAVAFQNCPGCGGPVELVVRRYRCRHCGSDVASRFLFDGLVFDAEYFRQKMVEHRERQRDRQERVRAMLLESRSPSIVPGYTELASVPGLVEALDSLVASQSQEQWGGTRSRFDLARYQSHIQAHLETFPISFDRIPILGEDARLDRVWRFIALIFMAHVGQVGLEQQRETILVVGHEAD